LAVLAAAIVSTQTGSTKGIIVMAWLFWSIVAAAAILASLIVAANRRPGERRGTSRRYGGPPAHQA
jgi:hypothetical protein